MLLPFSQSALRSLGVVVSSGSTTTNENEKTSLLELVVCQRKRRRKTTTMGRIIDFFRPARRVPLMLVIV